MTLAPTLTPVLVTPAAALPVTLDMFKAHARIDHDDDDAIAEAYLGAAVAHLDGWSGILGRALVTQVWRQDYPCFTRCLRLPLRPVASVDSVTWRDAEGAETTVAADDYALVTDALGASVQFRSGFAFPASLAETAPLSVTFTCGEEADAVPEPLKVAVLLLAAHWYANREAVGTADANALPFAVDSLIGTYRRIGV